MTVPSDSARTSFAGAPAPEPSRATVTRGHTGKNAKDKKTAPTGEDPYRFVEGLPWPRRVEHGRVLLELFARATGEEPVMWGPTMIGYGKCHYSYDTGREGDWFVVGFSPRKVKLSLYGIAGREDLLKRLGKHARGVGCVYVNKLEDIDLGVLEELVAAAYRSEG